jgi:hypothetical protein
MTLVISSVLIFTVGFLSGGRDDPPRTGRARGEARVDAPGLDVTACMSRGPPRTSAPAIIRSLACVGEMVGEGNRLADAVRALSTSS